MMEEFTRQFVPPQNIPAVVEAKWKPQLLIEGFVPFPKRLLRCFHRLFRGDEGLLDLAVVLAIADYRRPNLKRMPSLRFLAFVAGLSDDIFRERLKSLETRGLITVDGSDDALHIDLNGLAQEVIKQTESGGGDE